MSLRIIDYPHIVGESFYEEALQSMTQRLLQTGLVKSVYQVGGISSPGISDLDMVAVFKDEVHARQNILEGISSGERYLFIHNLYGIPSASFPEAKRFTFYQTYKLLAGEETEVKHKFTVSDLQTLKIQIALEYVLKLRITLFLQAEYKILRMRDLMLHVKALHYDLEFLGVTSGKITGMVEQVMTWRKNWFRKKPDDHEILVWWKGFYETFSLLVEELFTLHPFYLPAKEQYRIARNIILVPGKAIAFERTGSVLPQQLSFIGKKFFRLQNKINRFQIHVPIRSDHIPEVLREKFRVEQINVEYNRKYLPHYLPLTSSLHAI